MINNPKDFFQQIQNLCEELGLKMKAISESIAGFISKSDAESMYLKKTDAQSTYLGKTAKAESAKTADTATSATSATKATQDGNGAVISSTYLKNATASSTYLTKSDAQATYLGKDAKAQSATFADTATTATSANSALKATQDGDGNVISGTYLKNANAESTYLTKTDASSTYLGKTAKAASATTADSATKATQDSSGNNIEQTYAKKSEIPEVPEIDTSNLVVKSGNRGLLAGYEQTRHLTPAEDGTDPILLNKNYPDSISSHYGYDVTIENGEEGTAWCKAYSISMMDIGSVTIGSLWAWPNGEAPTLSGSGLLIACWNGRSGIVNFIPDGKETQQGGQSGGID